VNQKEVEYIIALKSNNPAIGYNQWPKSVKENAGIQPTEARQRIDSEA
jgi:hypothetical protein